MFQKQHCINKQEENFQEDLPFKKSKNSYENNNNSMNQNFTDVETNKSLKYINYTKHYKEDIYIHKPYKIILQVFSKFINMEENILYQLIWEVEHKIFLSLKKIKRENKNKNKKNK